MKKRIATFEKSLPIFSKYEEANQLVRIASMG